MPRMISSAVAGSPPSAFTLVVDPLELVAVDELARAGGRVALLVDADLLEHLADDQLDVLVVDVDALGLVDLLDLVDEVHLGLRPAADLEQLVRVQRALVELRAGLDLVAPRRRTGACGAGTCSGAPRRPASVMTTVRALSVSSIETVPSTSAIFARPFGLRASNSSTTRGRPCVMSAPATPPVWNVRIVSCVPGSPIDCAAMMPTASPISPSCRWPGAAVARWHTPSRPRT
jgi:hypothetical protein